MYLIATEKDPLILIVDKINKALKLPNAKSKTYTEINKLGSLYFCQIEERFQQGENGSGKSYKDLESTDKVHYLTENDFKTLFHEITTPKKAATLKKSKKTKDLPLEVIESKGDVENDLD